MLLNAHTLSVALLLAFQRYDVARRPEMNLEPVHLNASYHPIMLNCGVTPSGRILVISSDPSTPAPRDES